MVYIHYVRFSLEIEMKRFKFSILVLAGFLLFSSAAMVSGQNKGFRVQGNKVLEANGNQFIMRGVNYPHNWYANQLNTAIPAIAATGSNVVRVVLSNGRRWTRNTSEDIQSIINQCKQNKLIVILEVHDCTGYPEQSGSVQLSTAVDYWIEMKSVLVGQEDYVIINIANEPFGNNVAAATWLNEHKTAISRLRTNGFEHALMVDAANWGQDWEFIMRNGRSTELFNSDPLKKIIFSIHMYDVFNTGTKVNDYLNYFANTLNLPLVVGEFAADHGSGKPVAAQDVLTRCQQYGFGYLGWSWKGNSSGLESLDIAVDWNGTTLTTWGDLLVNGTNGIKATSKIATIFGGTNQPPTVSLTAPANSATFTAPASITISADATDPDGSITRVEFFNGTTKLGESTTSPYSYSWSNVAAGTYSITARATDNQGATATSAARSVTVNSPANQPPAVSLTAPANSATFTAPASITISADATDPDGNITRVEFFNGITKLGESTTTPYSYTWSNVAAGTYSITARATDNQGATATSAARSVTVNSPANQPPTVSLTAPANNATFTTPASFTISADATDPDGSIIRVEFFNGTTKLGESTTSPYSYSWNNVAAGTYSITARATDNQGATATSTARSVTVNSPANQPPAVSLTAPANSATFTAPASINISADATDPDGSITRVEFFNGTTKLGESTTSPYSYSWSNVAAGTYSITARATDNQGATATSAVRSVTVNSPVNQPPAVSLTTPANSATFTAPASITISASATDPDGNITRVEFFNGITKMGESTTTPYSYTWNNVAIGIYLITARATDNQGATATSAVRSVTVNLPVSAISRLHAGITGATLINDMLKLEVFGQNRLQVSLVSLKGELIYRGSFTEPVKLYLHSFAPSGTYVLSVQNTDKIILNQKVNLAER
jgi:UDP-glucose 4-epimerase